MENTTTTTGKPGFENSPITRNRKAVYSTLRVAQLDAQELDQDLNGILLGQFRKFLESLPTKFGNFLLKFEPEFETGILTAIWCWSFAKNDSTLGQQLMDMRYVYFKQNLQKSTKLAHFCLQILLPYCLERADVILKWFFGENGQNIARKSTEKLRIAGRILKLASFLVFLRHGVYKSPLERLLAIRIVHNEQPKLGQLDMQTVNRELIWHGFADFLLFLAPFSGEFLKISRKLRRKIAEKWRESDQDQEFDDRQKVITVGVSNVTECPICQAEPPCIPCTTGCCEHTFCYYCIRGNLLFDSEFFCPRCETKLKFGENFSFIGC